MSFCAVMVERSIVGAELRKGWCVRTKNQKGRMIYGGYSVFIDDDSRDESKENVDKSCQVIGSCRERGSDLGVNRMCSR